MRSREPGNCATGLDGIDLHPILRRIYTSRGVQSADELVTTLDRLLPPNSLGGLDAAVDLLEQAIRQQQRIAIVGDFDADGATSSALMMEALGLLGARHVQYFVPNRFEYGYGLTPEIVHLTAEWQPDLLVTVDNGISSIEGVITAKKYGFSVLITDHHLPGKELPAADAIVNPNLPDNTFASKNLAGVGVAFYVMLGLRKRLRETGWFAEASIAEPNLATLLDLVALGTVADVVPLDQNNRILVQQGLARIRAGCCRPGIKALIQLSGRTLQRLVATDMGFCIGPRLNAAGRLDDMSIGIECLLTQNPETAMTLAAELDQLNRSRREIEASMQDQALQNLDQITTDKAQLPIGLCLYDPGWHQGVIGILASRIKEKFYRPVIIFADGDESEIKGSARSIPGVHIRDVLDVIATENPMLLSRFGGHAMAAGLTISKDKLTDFQQAFDTEVTRVLNGRPLANELLSDGHLQNDEFTLNLAETLRAAGPWGQYFPEPLFDGVFVVQHSRIVGSTHLKLLLMPENGSIVLNAIAFNQAEFFPLQAGTRLKAAYRLDSNEYRGTINLQLLIHYMELE
ncbi:MAG: single-stranded-DNA-specific exonuclease RecJ [Gammaproteobacteria bacterium]